MPSPRDPGHKTTGCSLPPPATWHAWPQAGAPAGIRDVGYRHVKCTQRQPVTPGILRTASLLNVTGV